MLKLVVEINGILMENKESFWVVFHSAWGEDRGDAERRQDYDKKAWVYVQAKMEAYFEKHKKEKGL